LAVVVLFARQRRADGRERTQLRWLLWAAVMCLVVSGDRDRAAQRLDRDDRADARPRPDRASIAIGILDPEVRDVDALMGGTVVWAAVAGTVIALDRDPETTRRLVAQSRQDITDALADVRRMVHGLRRPPLTTSACSRPWASRRSG
jgi:hypothetical protein